jgi:hypothetical protein
MIITAAKLRSDEAARAKERHLIRAKMMAGNTMEIRISWTRLHVGGSRAFIGDDASVRLSC